jgi:prepilin-type N-terminal cleavage/methylation domain-containing protein
MNQRPRGFSLIELLVVMSTGGLLLSIAIGTVERAMRINQETTDQLTHARRLVQLTDQFRHDVHLASSTSLEQSHQAVISLLDRTITYSIDGNLVKRTELGPNDRRQIEQYELSERSEIVFGSLDAPKRTVITVIERTGLQHSPIRTERVIAAVIGKRFVALGEESAP